MPRRSEYERLLLEDGRSRVCCPSSRCSPVYALRGWWRRTMRNRRKRDLEPTPQRRIDFHIRGKFRNNKVDTSKYTILSFLPRFLWEQFRKYSNIFFLTIGLLQQIPGVSPTGRWTTLLPLTFILFLSALKELIEDVKRHKADRATNYHSKCLTLIDGSWTKTRWQKIQVGDFIKLVEGDQIPADILVLSSSEPNGIAYVETSNLDGETNLKIRKGVPKTVHCVTIEALQQLKGHIVCEGPNRFLYEFNGALYLDSHSPLPLTSSELLLRGSKLKNTNWIFGIAIYTGEESKLRLNSVKAPLKRSQIEQTMNIQVLFLFGTLLVLSLISAVAHVIQTRKLVSGLWYVDIVGTVLTADSFLLQFLTYVILYNNLIPISLQVTLEFVKFVQAFFINWDLDMYHKETDQPAVARTSNLNEELGQVKYVFTDKTGTLTRNIMEFKGCSIGGVLYGEIPETKTLSFADMLHHLSREDSRGDLINQFMTILAVCHTVVPEKVEDGYIYQASSPDESALVNGAANLGWQFTSRTPDSVTVLRQGVSESFKILNVIDFTSARKRMSVVVEDEQGNIKLFCKGADSVIFERLRSGQPVTNLTQQLESCAVVGLRTLCFGEVELTQQEYTDWNKRFTEASVAISSRERLVAEAAEIVERNLTLIGATAIEDKLQVGVPDCIASMAKADIKIWVLTGDKQETAINIGHSCHLLKKDMPLLILNAHTYDDTKSQLTAFYEDLGPNISKDHNVGLIIDGKTLDFALQEELSKRFLTIAVSCKAVICCRVSPLQKAEIVSLVKKYVGVVTLAIGDGANDVGMIQAANVGVGISGLEGTQAVCAADYAIAQFRFLKKLLLVHGMWNYYRICKLILYSFYKNICLYVMELWFQIYCVYSGQILFERWSIGLYNVLFTFTPPLALGLLDRFTDKDTTLKYPQMYKISQDSILFNYRVFWMWIINSIYHSVLLFYIPLYFIYNVYGIKPDGTVGGYLYLGNMAFGYTVIVVCIKAGLESYTWTWLHFLTIFGSILSWFLYMLAYSNMWPSVQIGAAEEMAGQDRELFVNPTFWLGCLIVPIACLFRDVLWKTCRRTFYPSIKEKIELHVKENKASTTRNYGSRSNQPRELSPLQNRFAKLFAPAACYPFNPSHELLPHLSTHQTGYAFSQEEGGVVSQSEMVRMVNSEIIKPRGD